MMLPARVFGTDLIRVQDLYGPPQIEEVEKPISKMITKILVLFKNLFISAFFLIGIIVYLKRSKDSKKKKVVVVLCFILIVIIICFFINMLVNFERNINK